MSGMTKAHAKGKESIAALELSRDTLATRLIEAMASHTQKQEIIIEMQNTIQTLGRIQVPQFRAWSQELH